MRVLHVVPTYLPATRYGGPIYSVHHLCRSLVRQGIEVHVATTSVDGKRDSFPTAHPSTWTGCRSGTSRARALRCGGSTGLPGWGGSSGRRSASSTCSTFEALGLRLPFQGFLYFLYAYFLRLGFLDGVEGF